MNAAVSAAVKDALASGERAVIGIDGCAAAGKTSLAAELAREYGVAVFHADDYFLPPRLKTAERLAEPGGNIDYERMYAEIILPLTRGEDVRHSRYDCLSQTLLPAENAGCPRVCVIEGAYCLHPYFGAIYTRRFVLLVSADEQRRRILARNGADMLARFEREWIPLENIYLKGIKNAETLYN